MHILKKLLLANTLVVAVGASTLGFALPSGANNYPPPIVPPGIAIAIKHTPETLTFPASGLTLPPAAIKSLSHTALIAKNRHVRVIYLIGYTDNVGSAAGNQRFSLERAQRAEVQLRADLKRLGITDVRFVVRGRGEANPVASNATAQGRAANRRVVIVL